MMMETASPIEIIWTLIGIAGVMIHSKLAWDRWIDLHMTAKHESAVGLTWIAWANLRRQIIYGCTQLCTVVLGVAAMILPDPPSAPVTFITVLASGSIIVEELLLIVNALWDTYDQGRLISMLKA